MSPILIAWEQNMHSDDKTKGNHMIVSVDRRTRVTSFFRTVLALVVLFGIRMGEGTLRAQAAADSPPVIFIAVDDLNDWVGCLQGHPQTSTPNIDRLAAKGTLFRSAHCPAPLCNPSRAALLSGLRPHQSGVYLNAQSWRPAMPGIVTLPEYFVKNGYHVAAGGKIFHGSFNEPGAFSEYFAADKNPSPARDNVRRPGSEKGKGKGNLAWGPIDVDDSLTGDAVLVDWAVERLNEKREKPLFLAVGFRKPHLSWFVPKKYFDQHPLAGVSLPPLLANDLGDVPAAGVAIANPKGDHQAITSSGLHQEAVQAYLAAISYHDAQLGRLLDAVDRHPRGKEAIIVYWSDHGWHLGEKEHWRKFSLWERATRVPLAVVAPGLTKPGTTCDQNVDLMALYPTIVELCGLPARPELKEPSLVPLLKDPKSAWPHAALTTYMRGNHAVRKDQWRYIRYADGSEELYDHSNDPNEWTNLANESSVANVKATLASLLPVDDANDARKGKGADKKAKKQNAKKASKQAKENAADE